MKAFRTFWSEFRATSSHPLEHATLVEKPLSSAMRYLYWLLFFVACASAIQIAVIGGMFIPKIAPFLTERAKEIRAIYPEDLVVTIKDGEVSTNAKEPVILEGPDTWKEALTESGATKHLLVIDTKASAEDFPLYNTLMLVTKTSLIAQDRNGTRIIPLDRQDRVDQEEITIDHQFVFELINGLEGILRHVPKISAIVLTCIVLIYPFLTAGLRWTWLLLYLLPVSLLVWAFSSILKRKYTFGECYRLTIYGVTLPVPYALVTRFFPMFYLPFVFTVILLIWMGIVLNAKQVKTHKTH